jgi:hypothetical protein
MKIKTNELIGLALDRAVMGAQGFVYQKGMPASEWSRDPDCAPGWWRKSPGGVWSCLRCHGDESPSTDWAQGGPIIEREKIGVVTSDHDANVWVGSLRDVEWRLNRVGPTPLIAAMRCYVASELGDTVEVLEELL